MTGIVDFERFPLGALLADEGFQCACGQQHKAKLKEAVIEQGALARTVEIMKKYGGTRPFLVSDNNTHTVAGKALCKMLDDDGTSYSSFVYPQQHLIPDEYSVGQAAVNFDPQCDFIIAVGSGTINDIGKILAKITGLKYMIVCTAPSMDGYASSTSSMVVNGIKVSIDSACPAAIVADTDMLCRAPFRLIQAGIGDMMAKYVSICEWRISHLVNKEYYCEKVARLIRSSTRNCVKSSRELAGRNPEAIAAIMEGLITAGVAMSFAGCSRPASGIEHYFSHIWDMRSLNCRKHRELHGIQVGVATLLSLRLFDFIRQVSPDRKKALEYVAGFNRDKWNGFLKSYLGKAGNELVKREEKEGKYNKQRHASRLGVIINNWQSILAVISREIPEYEEMEDILRSIGAPATPGEISITREDVRYSFLATKDIRDKYIASRLLWDLGLLDEAAASLELP